MHVSFKLRRAHWSAKQDSGVQSPMYSLDQLEERLVVRVHVLPNVPREQVVMPKPDGVDRGQARVLVDPLVPSRDECAIASELKLRKQWHSAVTAKKLGWFVSASSESIAARLNKLHAAIFLLIGTFQNQSDQNMHCVITYRRISLLQRLDTKSEVYGSIRSWKVVVIS